MKYCKIFMVVCLATLVLCLAPGCTEVSNSDFQSNSVATVTKDDGNSYSISDATIGFEELMTYYSSLDEMYYTYFRDRTTDVVYVWRSSGRFSNVGGYSYWTSGLTVMMDPVTGGPLLYENWLKYLEEKNNDTLSGSICPNCGAKSDSAYCGDCGSPMNPEG